MTSGHCQTHSTATWAGFSLAGSPRGKKEWPDARVTCRYDGRSEPSIQPTTERAPGRGVAKATINTEFEHALQLGYSIALLDCNPALPGPSPDPCQPVSTCSGCACASHQQGSSCVARTCTHQGYSLNFMRAHPFFKAHTAPSYTGCARALADVEQACWVGPCLRLGCAKQGHAKQGHTEWAYYKAKLRHAK